VALADSSGTVQTSYTYAPYGETTASGATSNNANNFTGRENDGDGLYFYRARYYNPVFSRFASEDPLGFAGGSPNLYGYAMDAPTNFVDPSGEIVPWLAACAAGAAFQVAIDMAVNSLSGRKNGIRGAAGSAASGCIGGLLGFGLSAAATKGLSLIVRGLVTITRPGVVAYASGRTIAITALPSRLAHVAAGHLAGGAESAGNSIFNTGEDLVQLMGLADTVPQVLQGAGRYVRLVSAGRNIGIDRATGAQTSVFTVITNREGALFTMFPGLP
jgi:RHS repeat-associated protein